MNHFSKLVLVFLFALVTVVTSWWIVEENESHNSNTVGDSRFLASTVRRIGVWSEFISYPQLVARLDDFAKNDVELFVAFNAKHPDYDGFAFLVKRAREAGVSVRPWLLLREEDGYWFNKWNVEKNAEFARTFLAEMQRRDVAIEWVTFDLEPPQDLVVALQEAFAKKSPRAALHTLRESAHSASLVDAKKKTRALLDDLHARGVKVHAVTTNFVLNDGKSERIQNALGVPVTGLPFDEISFMVYRPELQKILGKNLGSKIIEMYASRIVKRFGPNAGIDLGEAGFVPFPIPFQGFREPSELQADIAAARRAGVDHFHVYSLDGMSELGLAAWLAPGKTDPLPAVDVKASLFVKSISLLRNLLPKPH